MKEEQKNINEMSSEELGLLLNDQYRLLTQSQQNITNINIELQKRKELKCPQKNTSQKDSKP